MAQKVFLIYSCDAWKDRDSMRLVFCGTSSVKARKFIEKEIKNGDMEYGSPEEDRAGQARRLRQDWNSRQQRDIDSRLTYGTIDYCYNNDPDSL